MLPIKKSCSAVPYNFENGRIDKAHWIASPNHDARLHPDFINTLVIHAISLPPEQFGHDYVEAFFCNKLDHSKHPYFETIADLNVSAHFYIKRDGSLIQFVNTQNRAWHAGESHFKGQDIVNDFSIGIELEGCDAQPFGDSQYSSLVSLAQTLMTRYRAISRERIVGHSDISPGRKTDPGPKFDWQRFHKAL